MLTAVRLTREGRLDEAMAALRRSLSVAPLSDASPQFDADSFASKLGGEGLPRFSIPKALGGLVRRIGRFRPVPGLDQIGRRRSTKSSMRALMGSSTRSSKIESRRSFSSRPRSKSTHRRGRACTGAAGNGSRSGLGGIST